MWRSKLAAIVFQIKTKFFKQIIIIWVSKSNMLIVSNLIMHLVLHKINKTLKIYNLLTRFELPLTGDTLSNTAQAWLVCWKQKSYRQVRTGGSWWVPTAEYKAGQAGVLHEIVSGTTWPGRPGNLDGETESQTDETEGVAVTSQQTWKMMTSETMQSVNGCNHKVWGRNQFRVSN